MIFAGFPITIEWSGTSKLTYDNGAINTSLPILIFPIKIEFAPIQTLFPITGVPFLFPLFSCPITTPVAILQLSPILTLGLIIILPSCPI